MKRKLLLLILAIFLLNCEDTRKHTSSEIKEIKNHKRFDSLSQYEFGSTKKFVDSLKKYDTIKYFSLRRVIENDSINYYDKVYERYGTD